MPQSMIDVPAELAAMEKMAAKELRAKYEELYGEPTAAATCSSRKSHPAVKPGPAA